MELQRMVSKFRGDAVWMFGAEGSLLGDLIRPGGGS